MHAFLFADLRSYTAFAATRGDEAAARLLARYRSLVREEIARHDGAEIRTEGDSFYVVFPSVSAAVRCALAIAAAARAASAEDPSLPVAVGIGVHFGETVDTAEGSVGSAVNLAARLASAAGPNEVLVSDVVRSLTRTLPDVRTTAVGSRRLKGFAEAVPLFRAGDATGTLAAPRVRWRAQAPGAGILGLAVLALVGLGATGVVVALNGGLGRDTASPGQSSIASSPTPSAAPGATGDLTFREGRLEPGTYVDRDFVPNVRLRFVEQWCSGLPTARRLTTKTGPDLLYMFQPGTDITQGLAGDPCASTQRQPDAGFVSLNRVGQVYATTACEDGVTRSIGSWDALVDYLTNLPGTTVTDRASASFGGVLGVGFDLHVDAGKVCPQSGAPTRAVLAFPTTNVDRSTGQSRVAPVWWAEGQYIHLWVVDVDGRLVVGSIGHESSTAPVSRTFVDKAYRVIETLRFVAGG
jgi:class 3 adenylate cyclase